MFKDKVALVTGAGSGIGRATALAFAREGAKVVVSDIREDAGELTVAQIREAGGTGFFIEADVAQSKDVQALIARTVDTYGRLDFAHNNAGWEGSNTDLEDEDAWDRTLNINLKGVFLCLKYEIAQMLQQGGGAIVNTSSVAGVVGQRKGNPAYIASKHGVVGLTRWAGLTYAKQGIRVNAVCPGSIRTELFERVKATFPNVEARNIVAQPIGRMGMPDEIAAAVIWLCSDASSFVVGHAMPVDGGWTAQ